MPQSPLESRVIFVSPSPPRPPTRDARGGRGRRQQQYNVIWYSIACYNTTNMTCYNNTFVSISVREAGVGIGNSVVVELEDGKRRHYTILYYTILYYTILYYTILYYSILYYTILYYTILYYTIICYNILNYTIIFIKYDCPASPPRHCYCCYFCG